MEINFTSPGDGTIKMVELWVDDLPDTADLVRPFILDWSTGSLEDHSTHSVFVRAYYADNRRIDSKKINLTIDNSSSYPTRPRIITVQYIDEQFLVRWVRNEDEDFFAYYLYESFNEDFSDAHVYGPFTSLPGNESNPSFSHDRSQITFQYSDNSINQIYIMSLDGTNQVNLTPNGLNEENTLFAREDTYIFFQSQRDGNGEIYRMNPDGTQQINLTENSAQDFLPSLLNLHLGVED